jgi:SAM-dependent methyltransferase
MSADAIAKKLSYDTTAVAKLLNVLVSSKYLRHNAGAYSLAPVSRKWLLESSKSSLRDNILYRPLEWEAFDRMEGFIRTGEFYDVHSNMPAEYWPIYQRGMRSLARMSAAEVALRTPIAPAAKDMLDVGGSHGLYSVQFCLRYPNLNAVVLDLPAAIQSAKPLLAEAGMNGRVVHRAGDALTEDLGQEAWDLVFMSQIVHHFDAPGNQSLFKKVAQALRPGGVLAIVEMLRPEVPSSTNQTSAVLDLLFAATSRSGTWSKQELESWQIGAGLAPNKLIRIRTAPGVVIHSAKKQ